MMTTANKITIVRILLVPFFAYELVRFLQTGAAIHRWLALGLFLLAAIGDGVDGFIARRFHQKTELGAILDPLADKLLLVLGLLILSLHNQGGIPVIPLWLTITVLARDIMLVLLLILVACLVGRGSVRPHLTGKTATVLQMTCIVWVLVGLSGRWLPYLAAAATFFTAISGIIYLRAGIAILRGNAKQEEQIPQSPSSS